MNIIPRKFEAVLALVGGQLAQIAGGTIEYVDGQTPPSEEEINTKLAELQAEYEALQYQRDRQYPNLGEQLDMLFHDMTAGKGSKTGEWYKAIAKVKADNPK